MADYGNMSTAQYFSPIILKIYVYNYTKYVLCECTIQGLFYAPVIWTDLAKTEWKRKDIEAVKKKMLLYWSIV